MDSITVSLVQAYIAWENPTQNLKKFEEIIQDLQGKTDLVLLPEMFSTGFSMNPQKLAEKMDGLTVGWMKRIASKNSLAIGGSLIISENGKCFNRFVFAEPSGKLHLYDKRHLFRMAGEDKRFAFGNKRKIVVYKGFRFLLQICYDLRFPVWMRNRNDYDVMLLVANWPEPRNDAWKKLIFARAIENQCYVTAVNRVGVDGINNYYSGDSTIIDFMGKEIVTAQKNIEEVITAKLSKNSITDFRAKFPVWMDADNFNL
jgi:predicted amidohydrolase